MSEKQRKVLYDRTNGHYQKDLCSLDASGLLDRILNQKEKPLNALFHYADTMRIPVSYYYSDERLQGNLLHDLAGLDNIAFRVYIVYCGIKHIRVGNLLDSEHKDVFYDYAKRFSTEEELDVFVKDAWVRGMPVRGKIYKEITEYLKSSGIV